MSELFKFKLKAFEPQKYISHISDFDQKIIGLVVVQSATVSFSMSIEEVLNLLKENNCSLIVGEVTRSLSENSSGNSILTTDLKFYIAPSPDSPFSEYTGVPHYIVDQVYLTEKPSYSSISQQSILSEFQQISPLFQESDHTFKLFSRFQTLEDQSEFVNSKIRLSQRKIALKSLIKERVESLEEDWRGRKLRKQSHQNDDSDDGQSKKEVDTSSHRFFGFLTQVIHKDLASLHEDFKTFEPLTGERPSLCIKSSKSLPGQTTRKRSKGNHKDNSDCM